MALPVWRKGQKYTVDGEDDNNNGDGALEEAMPMTKPSNQLSLEAILPHVKPKHAGLGDKAQSL